MINYLIKFKEWLKERSVIVIVLLISLAYILIFIPPNSVGSRDVNMLSIFEQDEFAQYEHVMRILTPAESIKGTLKRVFVYFHYYYGYIFYLYSAVSLLPLRLAAPGLFTTSNIMLVLRQAVSVLPMVGSIMIWTYLYTGFRKLWPAIILTLFLFSMPAVIENNLWWHPDGLTVFFMSVTFWCLVKDNLNFGKAFLWAGFFCGLTTGTKLIGLFFFLTIPVYILIGVLEKKINLQTALVRAIQFVIVMAAAIVISNPLLLTTSGREGYLRIQRKQAEAMAVGWNIVSSVGLKSWWPTIREYYGNILILLVSLFSLGYGIVKNKNRLLNILVFFWAAPFAIYLINFIAIKPSHFFLPIIIPVMSSIVIWIDAGGFFKPSIRPVMRIITSIVILAIVLQFAGNLRWGTGYYLEKYHRQRDSPAINFYNHLEGELDLYFPGEGQITAYRDVRIYVPSNSRVKTEVLWEFPGYQYFQEKDYDLILIWNQRILDYTNEEITAAPVNPEKFYEAQEFYQDAKAGNIREYELIYGDDYGSAFLREKFIDN